MTFRSAAILFWVAMTSTAVSGQSAALRPLVAVVPPSSPFLDTTKTGGVSSFLVDLLNLVVPLAGFSYQLVSQPDDTYGMEHANHSWTGVVGSLINKQADIAPDLAIYASRDNVIDFTTPYVTVPMRILMNAADVTVNALDGSPDTRYMVLKDGSPHLFVMNSPMSNVRTMWGSVQSNKGFVSSYKEGVDKLLAGRGSALIGNTFALQVYREMHPEQLVYASGVLFYDSMAFGVQQGSPLRDPLSVAIEQLRENGKLANLVAHYGLDKTD